MSDAAPPPWVKRAPGLSATHKYMLMVLWGYGPYARTGPEDPDGERQPAQVVHPYPSRATLATLTGQAPGTVKSQLDKLRADGWIRRESGSTMTLAWRAPGCFEYGEGLISHPDRLNPRPVEISASPVEISTPAVEISTPAVEISTGEGLKSRPLSSNDLPVSTSKNVAVDARPTSGKPANATRPLDTRLPAMQPSVHTPQLPAHVEAELARAKREQAPEAMTRAENLADAHGFSLELLGRIEETSQAAHVALMTSGCATHRMGGKCWAALLAKNILDRGLTDDQVIRVLEHWELARASGAWKPPMGKLWWWGKATSGFVDEALGDDARPGPSRPQAAPPSSSYDWSSDDLNQGAAQ